MGVLGYHYVQFVRLGSFSCHHSYSYEKGLLKNQNEDNRQNKGRIASRIVQNVLRWLEWLNLTDGLVIHFACGNAVFGLYFSSHCQRDRRTCKSKVSIPKERCNVCINAYCGLPFGVD